MNNLFFKDWLMSEMADYGFNYNNLSKPKGGTDVMLGDQLFNKLDGSKIISELSRLPALGPNIPYRKWHDSVQYGTGPGSLQVSITPLGSMRVVIRRSSNDLLGEQIWLCHKVIPLDDIKSENKEISIAQEVYGDLQEVSNLSIYGPAANYDGLEKLAWRLWSAAKKEHPSYIMFPTKITKQNENYYKLVFEFRGHGVTRPNVGRQGRAEQFDIDLIWDKPKGLLRCIGYNIDSCIGQHSWTIQPAEFNEYFSPHQENDEIIENIIKTFMQY